MTVPAVSTTSTTTKTHVGALTGLRWFAAIAVFFHHSMRPDWLWEPVALVMAAGSNGVTFFFVLSGFVIALNYFDDAARPTFRGTWNYAVGRLTRIYPLYLLVLVVVWLTLGHHSNIHRFILHAFAVQAWHPKLTIAYGLNAPGWSIGVEFFLYACFPFLVLLLRPIVARPKLLLAIAVSVIVLVFAAAWMFQTFRFGLPPTNPFSAHRWLYRTPATHLGDFVLGMVAALLLRHARQTWLASTVRDRFLPPVLTWLPLGAILLLMAWPGRSHYYASLNAMWILPAGMLCLGLSLYPQSALGRFLATRPLVFLGEISFAFYLVHRPIMFALKAEALGSEGPLGYFVKTALLIILIAAVSVLCHFLCERPAQRILNRWLKLKAPAATATVPTAVVAQHQPEQALANGPRV